MGCGLVIHPDGTVVDVNLTPGGDHLALMREHLGCRLVDCIALTSRLDMWIDDEGLYTQPANPAATVLAGDYGHTWHNIHGPALLCTVNEDGDSVDLNTGQIRATLTRLADV